MKVELNEYGFYSAVDIPEKKALEEYYANVYYQESKGAYQKTYSDKEIMLIRNKLDEKYYVASQHAKQMNSFLDIGCGEGWALNYFKDKGMEICGLDFSKYGCSSFNPDCLDALLVGDIYENIDLIISEGKKFDVILMSNLLEHVGEPLKLLKKCNSLIAEGGILIIMVPNDFSRLQEYLMNNGYVDRQYWVCWPDHLSYFNKDGLCNIAVAAGWRVLDTIADFPIDFSLLNPNTNYIMEKEKGKSAHLQRVEVENLFYATSLEKTVNYYRCLADLGFGRQITAFFGKHQV